MLKFAFSQFDPPLFVSLASAKYSSYLQSLALSQSHYQSHTRRYQHHQYPVHNPSCLLLCCCLYSILLFVQVKSLTLKVGFCAGSRMLIAVSRLPRALVGWMVDDFGQPEAFLVASVSMQNFGP